MPAKCIIKPLEFEGRGRRRVVAAFDGGPITTDAGVQVTISVRRIKVAMASGCPYQREFRLARAHLPP